MLKFIQDLFNRSSVSSSEEKGGPDLDPKKLLRELQPKIEALAATCIGMKTVKDAELSLQSSKFGGLPYFPANETFPTAKNGKPLRLLAQLNFAELPVLAPYPEEGLLQFYIADDDDLYGLNFDNPADQSSWRVCFFKDLDFEPMAHPENLYDSEWEESPLHITPLGLTFELRKDYPTFPSLEYYERMRILFKGDYENFLEDLYLEQELSAGHKLGGFPYYTQNEIRDQKKAYLKHQLLFQMDSDGDKIMWGDVGVANFFIHPEDLEKRDFSNVLYNWDCH